MFLATFVGVFEANVEFTVALNNDIFNYVCTSQLDNFYFPWFPEQYHFMMDTVAEYFACLGVRKTF